MTENKYGVGALEPLSKEIAMGVKRLEAVTAYYAQEVKPMELLEGWKRVENGAAYAGDKYYCVTLGAWLPVTVNLGTEVKDYYAVIRRKEW